MSAYFVTGTDTDVGKTVVAAALLKHFSQTKGLSTIGFKPIAAGCEVTPQGLRNSDALSLFKHCHLPDGVGPLNYETVNPFAFEPPIAPHIAAKLAARPLSVEQLSTAYQPIKAFNTDITIVEGAGGWCLPLNDSEFLYQWVEREKLEVILVVGVKLGCLNHALLTQAFIQSQGLTIKGWVANIISEQMSNIEENIATLKHQLHSPLLGTVPFIKGQDLDDVVIEFRV
jgi:dethiobiotin synthetase